VPHETKAILIERPCTSPNNEHGLPPIAHRRELRGKLGDGLRKAA
jgi:hypothetical protein